MRHGEQLKAAVGLSPPFSLLFTLCISINTSLMAPLNCFTEGHLTPFDIVAGCAQIYNECILLQSVKLVLLWFLLSGLKNRISSI